MSNESDLMKKIMLKLGSIKGVRVFRNNVAVTWTGKSVRFVKKQTVNVQPGDVLIQNARVLHAGLCKGSSDIIGFKSVNITPDMVGKTVAIFIAPEVKTISGKISTEQEAFINTVNRFGGIAAIVRSEEEAEELFRNK